MKVVILGCTRLLFVLFVVLAPAVFGEGLNPPRGKYAIKKIATFESFSGPVFIGNNGIARVVEIMGGGTREQFMKDSALIAQQHPGWKGETWQYTDFQRLSKWREEVGRGYTNKPETLFLPGDTVKCKFECFDEDGTINLRVDTGLPKKFFPKAYKIKHFEQADIDSDGQKECILVFTDESYPESPPDRPPFAIAIYDLFNDKIVIRLWEVYSEAGRVGRLEIRDVTQDGCPEVIFRVFWPGGSGYTNQAHIYGVTH